jgi:hypothetical protein
LKTKVEIRARWAEVEAQIIELSKQLEQAETRNDQKQIRANRINRLALKGQLELLNWILGEEE